MAGDIAGSHTWSFVVSSTRVAALVDALRRLASTIRACEPAIFILTIGILFLIALYRVPMIIITDQAPRLQIVPPVLERVLMLALSLGAFVIMFLLVEEEWDWRTRPMTTRINNNARVGFAKAVGIWFMVMSLSPGLDLMLRPYTNVDSLQVGIVVAFFLVLYAASRAFSIKLHEIAKDFLLTVLGFAVVVNIFVTIPAALPPLREMALVAMLATIADGLLSLLAKNWSKIMPVIAKVLG